MYNISNSFKFKLDSVAAVAVHGVRTAGTLVDSVTVVTKQQFDKFRRQVKNEKPYNIGTRGFATVKFNIIYYIIYIQRWALIH